MYIGQIALLHLSQLTASRDDGSWTPPILPTRWFCEARQGWYVIIKGFSVSGFLCSRYRFSARTPLCVASRPYSLLRAPHAAPPICAERYIQHPMQTIFNPPMTTDALRILGHRSLSQAMLELLLPPECDQDGLRLDHGSIQHLVVDLRIAVRRAAVLSSITSKTLEDGRPGWSVPTNFRRNDFGW